MLCSEACEYDIGGYSNNGLAWRWRISSAWHEKLKLNLLEFVASAVTIYIAILQMGQGSYILAFTDSSITLGWMHKAHFDLVNAKSHNEVARYIEWKLFSNETSIYSQHIKGTENIIADYLSRYFYRSDYTLTKHFNQILPP